MATSRPLHPSHQLHSSGLSGRVSPRLQLPTTLARRASEGPKLRSARNSWNPAAPCSESIEFHVTQNRRPANAYRDLLDHSMVLRATMESAQLQNMRVGLTNSSGKKKDCGVIAVHLQMHQRGIPPLHVSNRSISSKRNQRNSERILGFVGSLASASG